MSKLDPTPLLGTRERPRRDRVLTTLSAFAPALAAVGLSDVCLFGSVARDEATEKSDVDILATVREADKFNLKALVSVQSELALALRAAPNFVLVGVDRHSVVAVCRFHPGLLEHVSADLIVITPPEAIT
jgi:predicted nucleotidyltransferase